MVRWSLLTFVYLKVMPWCAPQIHKYTHTLAYTHNGDIEWEPLLFSLYIGLSIEMTLIFFSSIFFTPQLCVLFSSPSLLRLFYHVLCVCICFCSHLSRSPVCPLSRHILIDCSHTARLWVPLTPPPSQSACHSLSFSLSLCVWVELFRLEIFNPCIYCKLPHRLSLIKRIRMIVLYALKTTHSAFNDIQYAILVSLHFPSAFTFRTYSYSYQCVGVAFNLMHISCSVNSFILWFCVASVFHT